MYDHIYNNAFKCDSGLEKCIYIKRLMYYLSMIDKFSEIVARRNLDYCSE